MRTSALLLPAGPFAFVGIQQALSQANAFRRHFNQFVIRDIGDGLLEAHPAAADKDGTGQFLTAINIICWNAKFKVNKIESEQEKFYTNFYSIFYRCFEKFFKGKGIDFELERIFNPVQIENEVANFIDDRKRST